MYNLQNGIQFETNPTPNTGNGDFKNSNYPSIYIAVLLAVHVVDGDFPVREQCVNIIILWILYSAVTMKDNNRNIYVYGNENNSLRLYFHDSFDNTSLILVSLDYRVFEFAAHVFQKVKHSLSIAHVKNRQYLWRTLSARTYIV